MNDSPGRITGHRSPPVLPGSADLLRRIIDQAAVSMAIAGADGQCLYVNAAFCAMFGHSVEECVGRTVDDIVHPDDRAAVQAGLDALRRGDVETARAERRYVRKTGETFWGMVSASALRDAANGAPTHYILQIVDIEPQKQAEADLTASELRWNVAMSSAGQGIWDWDLAEGRIWRSRQCRAMLGFPEGEIRDVGDSWWRGRLHPDDVGRVLLAFDRLVAGRDADYDMTYRLRHKDGRWLWILARGKVVQRALDGRPLRLIGTNTDVTAKTEAEARAGALSERLQVAIEAGGVGIYELDVATGRYRWDERMHDLYGMPPGGFDGTLAGWLRLIHPDDVPHVMRQYDIALQQTSVYQADYRILHQASGGVRHVRSLARIVRAPDGTPLRAVGTNWDITDHKQAEARQSALNERLEIALDAGGVGIFEVDFFTGERLWDDRTYELHGTTRDGFDRTPEGFRRLLPAEDVVRVNDLHETAARDQVPQYRVDYRVLHQSTGTTRHIRASIRLTYAPDGTLLRGLGACWDITDDVERNRRLHDTLTLLQAVMNGTPDLIYVKDLNGRYLLVNPAVEKVMAREGIEIIGRHDTEIFPSGTARGLVENDRRVLETGEDLTTEEIAVVGGVARIYSSAKVPLRDEHGAIIGLIGTSRDLTEVKAAEAALRRSEARWQFALDGAGDGIWDWDIDTGHVFYSRQWKAMLGYGEDEVGATVGDWSDRVHPEDQSRCWAIINDHLAGRSPDFVLEHRMRARDGSWRWIFDRGKVVERTEDGLARRVIGTHSDITERKRAEDAMRALNQRLQLAIEGAGAGIFELDCATGRYSWDDQMHVLYELAPGGFDGSLKAWLGYLHPDDVPRVMRGHEEAVERTSLFSMDFRIRRQRSGAIRHIRSLARVIRHPDGRPSHAVGMNWDITDHVELAEALFEEKERLRVTLHSIGDAVISTDALARVTFMNPAAEQMTGWPAEEAMGCPLYQVFRLIDEAGHAVPDPVESCLARMQPYYLDTDVILLARDDERRHIRDSAAPVRTASGEVIGAVLVFQDVTRDRTLQQALAHSATHDSLTGLPNRAAFERALAEACEQARREGRKHVLCFMDLDRFKIVNDGAGHAAGDALLRDVANLLRRNSRSRDLVARLGGDEFALLLRDCSVDDGVTIARQFIRAVAELRFTWDDKAYQIGASIGLTAVAADGTRADELLSQSDVACYTAKTAGRSQVSVYGGDGSAAQRHRRDIQVAAGIRDAIEADRFRLFAQEIRDLRPGREQARHVEILLRMQDGNGEMVEPSGFIPASERYDLMGNIDRWVIRAALHGHGPQLRASPDLSIGINLSANTLDDPFLWPFLKEELAASGLNPGRLHFEITETAVINNLAAASRFVAKVRAAGCAVVLDDFGSGLSSFAYLRQFPVDGLKIDGGFIRQITTSAVDRVIVESINAIGHRLGTVTVAEQVEDAETLALVRAMGIDQAQGFAVGRPRPLDSLF
jgi:diguanylate cyclase (GGDEF)-like protein/PAS domain S-box-containing protein